MIAHLGVAAAFALSFGLAAPRQVPAVVADRASALEQEIRLRPRVAELYVELAREYEHAGDRSRAEAALRRGLDSAWEQRALRGALVDLLVRAGRWSDAVAAAEPLAADTAVRAMTARLRFNAGIAAYRAGERARARAFWADALRDDPALLEASVNLASALLEEGKRDSAQAVVRRGLEAHPTDVRLLALHARTLSGAAGLAAALAAMRQSRAQRPDDESVGLQLASLYAASGNRLAAMALYDTLVRAPAATERTFTAAVAFWLDGGQLQAAVTVGEMGVAKFPRAGGLYASLGEAHASQSQWAKAADAYRHAIALARDREPLELALLDVYATGGDSAAALALARDLTRRPASRATLLRAAERVAPLRGPDAAAIYDAVLARDSSDDEALEAAATLADASGDTARAVGLARRAASGDSSGPAPLLLLLRLARPAPDSARLLLRRALWRGVDRLQELELRTAGALGGNLSLRTLSRAKPDLTRKQRLQEQLRWILDTVVFHTEWGRAELAQLRLAYPQSAILARYGAAVDMRDGSDSVALAEYERVLRRDPTDTDAQLERAALLLRMHRTADAIDGFSRALDADPSNDSTFRALRDLRERQGTLDALLAQLRRLRARLPDARPLAEHEIEVLQRLGRLQEAQTLAAELAKGKKP